MDKVEAAEQVKGPVAPPEPISPAKSATSAPTSASALASASVLTASAPAPALASASAAPTSSATSTAAPAKPPSPAPSTTAPTAATVSSDKVSTSPSVTNRAPAPVVHGPPSPARDAPAVSETSTPATNNNNNNNTATTAASSTVSTSAPAKQSVLPPQKDTTPPNYSNGNVKNGVEDGDPESELSEPDSNLHSPPGVGFNEPEDEIIVRSRVNGAKKLSPRRAPGDREDEVMADANDEPTFSHYPKRKRTSLYNDLSENKIEIPTTKSDDRNEVSNTPTLKNKPSRQSLSSVKGVIVGYWRDSPAPDLRLKHAVIGFIDVRDRLRTRIQPITTSGDPVPSSYPLPPGPGGSWVTFERIVFLDHLVGLDHYQVKEYVRLRSDAYEDSDAARKAAEREAVKEAIRRAKQNQLDDPSPLNNPPTIAYGLEIPDGANAGGRPEVKRRRVSGGFSAINPAPSNGIPQEQPVSQQHSPAPAITRNPIDPLPGTRPTRILLGYWKLSSEKNPEDRHAVYGILGQNDMFRVKLVRETRDGRFVDGNFPTGAGALWIAYEEVEFERHLKPLTRLEIKEYCRVRQWQLDHGEKPDERISNETKAVFEAQARVGAGLKALSPTFNSFGSPAAREDAEMSDNVDSRNGVNVPELRQSRRVEARQERPLRQAPPPPPPVELEPRPASRVQNNDALERTSTLARREIARAEAAQGRADRHAANRERAAAAAADATAAAAAAAIPAAATNGRMRFHESEEMQRLNKVWARQENLRMKAGAEDAKMYGGIKYERKANGPFMGKLVSQGTIISIDGEDFVEYRVLTKPSFF